MLLTAGCSFVWGDELEGFDQDPPTHWDKTFTAILAKKLGIEYKNRGFCGACNDKIFRETIDFLHSHPQKDDITHLVVMWSAWQRKEVVEYMPPDRDVKIGRQIDVTQFSQLRTETIFNLNVRKGYRWIFDNSYDSRTDIMHTLSKMKALEVICEARGITLVQGMFHKRNWSNIMSVLSDERPSDSVKELGGGKWIDTTPDFKEWLLKSISGLNKNSRIGMGTGKDMYTMGMSLKDIKEYGHPGEKTQVMFADQLHELIAKSSQ